MFYPQVLFLGQTPRRSLAQRSGPFGILLLLCAFAFQPEAVFAGLTLGPKTDYPTGAGPHLAAIGNLDGDAWLDVAVANQNGGTVSVLRGNGDGTFAPKTDFGSGATPTSVAIADLNGDGKSDLVVTNYEPNTVSVLLGNGDATFQSPITFDGGFHPYNVAIGDLNGDGRPDLALTQNAAISILIGNGTFQPRTDYPTAQWATTVAIGDLNGDGKPDLAVTNNNSNSVSVLRGNGDGTFQPKTDYPAGLYPHSVAIGDLNADGKPDLVVANLNANTVSVFQGNGDATFLPRTDYMTAAGPYSVATRDLDGDGRLDLAVAASVANVISVLLGAEGGGLADKTDYGTGLNPNSVAIANLNGDTKPDLVVANINSHTVSVLLNQFGETPLPPIRVLTLDSSRVGICPGGTDLTFVTGNAFASVRAALQSPANFGPSGVIRRTVEFLSPVYDITTDVLAGVDIVLLATLPSPGEVSALDAFVQGGGGLFVFQNDAASSFGAAFGAVAGGLGSGCASVSNPSTPVTAGPFGVVAGCIVPEYHNRFQSVGPDGSAFLSDGFPVGVSFTHGLGHAVLICDEEWCITTQESFCAIGSGSAATNRLFLNAVAYVAPSQMSLGCLTISTDISDFTARTATTLQATFNGRVEGATPSPVVEGSVSVSGQGLYVARPGGPADLCCFSPHLTSPVLTANGNEEFDITFGLVTPTAVGLEATTNRFVAATVSVFDLSDTLLGSFDVPLGPNTRGFLGITACQPIGRVRWQAVGGATEDTGIDEIRVGDRTPPSAPSNLTANLLCPPRASLTWQDNSNNETGFEIQEEANGLGNWATVGTPLANETEWTSGPLPTGTHAYRIRSCRGSSCSDWAGPAMSQPVFEIASAFFDRNQYTADNLATLTVTVHSLAFEGQATVTPAVRLRFGEPMSLESGSANLTIGATTDVSFVWTVPAVQGQAIIDLTISVDGQGCSAHREITNVSVVNELTAATIQAGQQQLQECGTTTAQSCEDTPENYVRGMLPFLGTADGVVATVSDACLAVQYWNSGRHLQSAAMWLVSAADAVGSAFSFAGDIACVSTGVGCISKSVDDLVPGVVSGAITCLTSVFDSPVASEYDNAALPLSVAGESLMDWLPDSLQFSFVESGHILANLLVCSGSSSLEIEADSSFTTADSVGHSGVVVMRVGSQPVQFAAIERGATRPYHEGANPTDAATIRLVANAPDTCRIVLFHQGETGPVTRLFYGPALLDSGGTATLTTAQDSTNFIFSVDQNGDGSVDWLLYPGGTVAGVEPEPPTANLPPTVGVINISPNPTSASTQILLRVRGAGVQTRLVVYDLVGRMVAQQDLGILSDGDKVVTWDGRAITGKRVASGVYFIQARYPGGASDASRMVLLR